MNHFLNLTLAASATLLVSASAQANELSIANSPFPNLSLASDGPNLGGYIIVHYGDDDDGAEMKFRSVWMEMKGTRGDVKYAIVADFKGTLDDFDGADDEAVSLKDAKAVLPLSRAPRTPSARPRLGPSPSRSAGSHP